uniref:Claudin n=1 Tax=Sinocyclocheilus grahami TaxID=75366 RepID=A0A672L054_SINGR
MASLGLQILGVALSSVGLLGSIMTCVLPMWRVTAFIGNNIVTAQIIWEGLWMSCVVQSTGHMQCKVYDSLLALSSDLQAARALLVLSIVLSVFGILLAVVGGKCTTCIENKTTKARVVKLIDTPTNRCDTNIFFIFPLDKFIADKMLYKSNIYKIIKVQILQFNPHFPHRLICRKSVENL